jgi:Calcineurin-like phosphoesterase
VTTIAKHCGINLVPHPATFKEFTTMETHSTVFNMVWPVLNSYSDCTEGSVQYEWLTTELRDRVNRQATPWLLVSFHAPLYTTFLGHVNEIETLNMKRAMEPLFNNYGVNLIISGKLLGGD